MPGRRIEKLIFYESLANSEMHERTEFVSKTVFIYIMLKAGLSTK